MVRTENQRRHPLDFDFNMRMELGMRLPKSFDTFEVWDAPMRVSAGSGQIITSEYIHQDGLKYLFAIICKSTLAECTRHIRNVEVASNSQPSNPCTLIGFSVDPALVEFSVAA